jgi:phosphonate transport system substrate-binding protein
MTCTRRVYAARVALLLLSTAALFVGGAGCSDKVGANSSTTQNRASPAGDGNGNGAPAIPKKLVFGFVPSTEADKIADDAKPIADFLSKELGMPVTTFTSTQYAGLIEAMGWAPAAARLRSCEGSQRCRGASQNEA